MQALETGSAVPFPLLADAKIRHVKLGKSGFVSFCQFLSGYVTICQFPSVFVCFFVLTINSQIDYKLPDFPGLCVRFPWGFPDKCEATFQQTPGDTVANAAAFYSYYGSLHCRRSFHREWLSGLRGTLSGMG